MYDDDDGILAEVLLDLFEPRLIDRLLVTTIANFVYFAITQMISNDRELLFIIL
jgi:hypothetical protein